MNDDQQALANFSGMARLFPLPDLVLFPHVVHPLHVFEPRYRQMTANALASDRLIAPVLLRPGWEPQYEGRPAIYPVACLGRLVAEQKLPDGRYNLLVRGLSRMRIRSEVQDGRAYRTARGSYSSTARCHRSRKRRRCAKNSPAKSCRGLRTVRRGSSSASCSAASCRSARCATSSGSRCRSRSNTSNHCWSSSTSRGGPAGC